MKKLLFVLGIGLICSANLFALVDNCPEEAMGWYHNANNDFYVSPFAPEWMPRSQVELFNAAKGNDVNKIKRIFSDRTYDESRALLWSEEFDYSRQAAPFVAAVWYNNLDSVKTFLNVTTYNIRSIESPDYLKYRADWNKILNSKYDKWPLAAFIRDVEVAKVLLLHGLKVSSLGVYIQCYNKKYTPDPSEQKMLAFWIQKGASFCIEEDRYVLGKNKRVKSLDVKCSQFADWYTFQNEQEVTSLLSKYPF